MKKKLIVVTGIPRSGTSMMMRTLEMGGIPCVYQDNHPEEMKKKMKNIYGFFEGGTIPEQGGVAVKRFGKVAVERLSKDYDCYFIFMQREPRQIQASWQAFSGDVNKGKPVALEQNQKKVKDEVIKEKHIIIEYNTFVMDTENELNRLQAFLPLPLNVKKAFKAVDRYLYVNR